MYIELTDFAFSFYSYTKIYSETESVISQIIIEDDLISYQKTYGPDHPFVPLEYIVNYLS